MITRVVVPERPDLKKSHDFKIGDRVRHTASHARGCAGAEGVVAFLPSRPPVQIGTHIIGNEMGMDCPDGTRRIDDVDKFEKI